MDASEAGVALGEITLYGAADLDARVRAVWARCVERNEWPAIELAAWNVINAGDSREDAQREAKDLLVNRVGPLWRDLTSSDDSDGEAKAADRVLVTCEIAGWSLGQLDDECERSRFEKLAATAHDIALGIQDSFYRSAALHSIAVLLARANQPARALKILHSIPDLMIHSKAKAELGELGIIG